MVVIPARSMDEIATDIDNAKATKQLALNREAQADNRIREIESSIETRESSLKDIDRRKDDAKNGKRDPELIALQIESKVSKQAIDLLKRLRDLRKPRSKRQRLRRNMRMSKFVSLRWRVNCRASEPSTIYY